MRVRHPRYRATDLDDALGHAERLGGSGILDLENTVVPYQTIKSVADLAELVPRLSVPAVFVSNARWTRSLEFVGDVPLVGAAHKPFVRSHRLRRALLGASPRWVVGDQVLTDGLLAVRLGVPFIQTVLAEECEPRWPRTMRTLGRLLAPVLFRETEC